ncbi:MAG: hypothetical protein M3245_01110, partial [Actinomycetota bacterium]|nr:hypothetical protein [Actinomycetota bacterium]
AEGEAGLVPSGPLADGKLTLAELREVTFKTASARPERQFEDGSVCATGPFGPTPIQWTQVPPEYPEYIHIGYGAVDNPSRALAFQVLRGERPLPDRSRTDTYFALDDTARRALHQVYRG